MRTEGFGGVKTVASSASKIVNIFYQNTQGTGNSPCAKIEKSGLKARIAHFECKLANLKAQRGYTNQLPHQHVGRFVDLMTELGKITAS